MTTHAENVADPSMVLIEIDGEQQWVRRTHVRGWGHLAHFHRPGRQSVALIKNHNLRRTFSDPEWVESKGGLASSGSAASATKSPPTNSGILPAQQVDLNTLGAEMAESWHVEEHLSLAIQATLNSGTWDTAEVQVRGSLDNKTWSLIATLTGIGFTKGLDITDYTFVQITTSVVEGGPGVGRFYGYATNFL